MVGLRHGAEGASGKLVSETGSGMGATLNFVQSDSYTLTDRATWLAFANKFQHWILFEGDPALFNQYGIVTCRRTIARTPPGGGPLADWLLVPRSGPDRRPPPNGEQLFILNARQLVTRPPGLRHRRGPSRQLPIF